MGEVVECYGIAATPRKNKIEQRRRWATARAVDSITVCWVGGAKYSAVGDWRVWFLRPMEA